MACPIREGRDDERALREAARLPEFEQARMARLISDEIEDEARCQNNFENYQDQPRRAERSHGSNSLD